MGSHPLNLAIRFLLELAALIAVGIWGWKIGDGWTGYLYAGGIPILFAVIWGVFAVPGDPSRSGNAPVVTSGPIRLLLELTIFSFSTWTLLDIGYERAGIIFGIIVLLHYIVSYDRVVWLLSRKRPR